MQHFTKRGNFFLAYRRKTILSALLTDNKQYRDLMMQDVQEYNKDISKQEKTPEQVAAERAG